MKKMIMLVLALSLAIVLAACNDDSANQENKDNKSEETTQPKGEQAATEEVKITDEEKVDSDKVVSQVNGEEITGKQYNASYAQTKMLMNSYGQDVSDLETVKSQTLSVIVEQELLKQAAAEKGIEVKDEEVQNQLETIKSENADQFDTVLEQYHLTEESYKDQLAFEITLQKYMKAEIKAAEVTDEEVQSYYDKLKEQGKDVPKLEEVREQIKGQLSQQAQQEKLQANVKQLKEKAEIKHNI